MYPLLPPPPALLLPVLPTKSSLTLTHRHSHTRTHIITHTHAHTHTSSLTHLLRNIFANSDVECIIRAKNTSIKPDRSDLMTRSEKQCEVNHSTSLLDKSFWCSSSILYWQRKFRLRKPYRYWSEISEFGCFGLKQFEKRNHRQGGSWVSHIPSRKLDMNIEAGTSIQRPRSISQNVIAVFVGCRTMTFPAAPC